ncbi:hypothetical protein H0X48_06260 [Candidatus Dependentiae bacterium]|nr:hypothetical protein [Candidatus Dependentiae bacterium]
MIKKILCLILSLALATTELGAVSFRLQHKPTHTIFNKRGYTISALLIAAEILLLYKCTYPGTTKHRYPSGQIAYWEDLPSDFIVGSFILNFYPSAIAASILAWATYEKHTLHQWNNRTNKEIYDDAHGTYTYIKDWSALAYSLIKQLNTAPTVEEQAKIKNMYLSANYNPLTILQSYHSLFENHYEAVLERLDQDTTLTNNAQWTELKEDMQKELDKIITSIAFLSEIK